MREPQSPLDWNEGGEQCGRQGKGSVGSTAAPPRRQPSAGEVEFSQGRSHSAGIPVGSANAARDSHRVRRLRVSRERRAQWAAVGTRSVAHVRPLLRPSLPGQRAPLGAFQPARGAGCGSRPLEPASLHRDGAGRLVFVTCVKRSKTGSYTSPAPSLGRSTSVQAAGPAEQGALSGSARVQIPHRPPKELSA